MIVAMLVYGREEPIKNDSPNGVGALFITGLIGSDPEALSRGLLGPMCEPGLLWRSLPSTAGQKRALLCGYKVLLEGTRA